MKYISITLLAISLNVSAGVEVPCPDADNDGIPEFKSCKYEDDGYYEEEPLDNSAFYNPRQLTLGGEDDGVPMVEMYDLDDDGDVDLDDYSVMHYLTELSWWSAVRGNGWLEAETTGFADLNDNGVIDYGDKCKFILRNEQLSIYLPPRSSCYTTHY